MFFNSRINVPFDFVRTPRHHGAHMKLVFSLACEEVRSRPDGRMDVLGVFNQLSAPGFPAAQDRMTVIFVLEWTAEEAGDQPLRADMLDDEGNHVLTIQGHTEVAERSDDRAPAQTRLVLPMEKVVFPHAGRYTFHLKASEQTVPAFSLFVGLA
jgi:hypothetical protein